MDEDLKDLEQKIHKVSMKNNSSVTAKRTKKNSQTRDEKNFT